MHTMFLNVQSCSTAVCKQSYMYACNKAVVGVMREKKKQQFVKRNRFIVYMVYKNFC